MDLKDCIEFANKNPVCWLATMDGNQPRVRGFLLWYADKSGFYFHTGTTKKVYKQLKTNPKLEVCFFAPAPNQIDMKMMRLAVQIYTGEAHFWKMENNMRESGIERLKF